MQVTQGNLCNRKAFDFMRNLMGHTFKRGVNKSDHYLGFYT